MFTTLTSFNSSAIARNQPRLQHKLQHKLQPRRQTKRPINNGIKIAIGFNNKKNNITVAEMLKKRFTGNIYSITEQYCYKTINLNQDNNYIKSIGMLKSDSNLKTKINNRRYIDNYFNYINIGGNINNFSLLDDKKIRFNLDLVDDRFNSFIVIDHLDTSQLRKISHKGYSIINLIDQESERYNNIYPYSKYKYINTTIVFEDDEDYIISNVKNLI